MKLSQSQYINMPLNVKSTQLYKDCTNNPSICYNHVTQTWHLYFSYKGLIGHMISKSIEGPWYEAEPIKFAEEVSSPGVSYHNGQVHMALNSQVGVIYAISDSGFNFEITSRIIPFEETPYISDPGIAKTKDYTYLVFTDNNKNVVLAKSQDINTAWERETVINKQNINFENPLEELEYKWEIESPEIVLLENNGMLLTATAYLKNANSRVSNKIFWAHAPSELSSFAITGFLDTPKESVATNPSIEKVDNNIYVAYELNDKIVISQINLTN